MHKGGRKMSYSYPRRFLVFLLVILIALLGLSTVMAAAAEKPKEQPRKEPPWVETPGQGSPGGQAGEESAAEAPQAGPNASPAAYEVEKVDEDWTMWDGITLPVTVYYPASADPGEVFPVIVLVHGWVMDKTMTGWAAEYYAARGYVCVAFTARGWFGAGGEVGCMDPEHEMKDVSQIITLVSRDQRFPVLEDEKGPVVGITGASMGGCFSYLMAPRKNPRPGDPGDPRIRAVVPMHGSFDMLFSLYPNGAVKFFWTTGLLLSSYMGDLTGFLMNMLGISMDDKSDGWQKLYSIIDAMWGLISPITDVTQELPYVYGIAIGRNMEQETYAKNFLKVRSARYWCDEEYDGVVEHPITAPMLILAGWNDDLFFANEGLMAYSCTEAPKRIIITNHGHLGCYPGPYPGDIPGSPESAWVMEQVDRWFDRYLKGVDNGVEKEPGVAFYRDRDPANFGEADAYPLPGTRQASFYLGDNASGGGSLSTRRPRRGFQPDFLLNIGITGSVSLFYFQDAPELMGGETMDVPRKMDFVEIPFTERSYISEPLPSDVTVMGPPQLEVYYQCSAPFAQLDPWLYEVAPDGKEILISRGFYEGHDEQTWSMSDTAGQPIEMQACYHRFQKGSRIKLEIATADLISAWPYWNLVFILLHHSKDAASRLILPVIPNTY